MTARIFIAISQLACMALKLFSTNAFCVSPNTCPIPPSGFTHYIFRQHWVRAIPSLQLRPSFHPIPQHPPTSCLQLLSSSQPAMQCCQPLCKVISAYKLNPFSKVFCINCPLTHSHRGSTHAWGFHLHSLSSQLIASLFIPSLPGWFSALLLPILFSAILLY